MPQTVQILVLQLIRSVARCAAQNVGLAAIMKPVTVVNAKRRNANLLVWKEPVALIMVAMAPVAVALIKYVLKVCARVHVRIHVIH